MIGSNPQNTGPAWSAMRVWLDVRQPGGGPVHLERAREEPQRELGRVVRRFEHDVQRVAPGVGHQRLDGGRVDLRCRDLPEARLEQRRERVVQPAVAREVREHQRLQRSPRAARDLRHRAPSPSRLDELDATAMGGSLGASAVVASAARARARPQLAQIDHLRRPDVLLPAHETPTACRPRDRRRRRSSTHSSDGVVCSWIARSAARPSISQAA